MRLLSFAAAIATALVLFAPHPAAAQPHRGPDTAAQRAAIARLAPLVGRWEGEANVTAPAPMLVHQTEEVETSLDGLLLVIKGVGHASAARSGAPVFRAMAVISYDTQRNVYEVRAYTHEGYATTATGEFLEDGRFRWGFAPGGPVQMRFTMQFDDASWSERGEISLDNGATWAPTVDLALSRAG